MGGGTIHLAEQLYNRVLDRLDLSKEMEDEELIELIHSIMEEWSQTTYISLQEKSKLGRELFNTFRKWDILQDLLENEYITEIMINGIDHIFYEKNGQIFEFDKRFISKDRLEDLVQQMVSDCNRIVNESSPIVDARLAQGDRVNVVLPPVALNGPVVTIRKFPKEPFTMAQLVEMGAVSEDVVELLRKMVVAGYNIFISGGTGSGKTTFLNALAQFIPSDERIITIEDNAELQIKGISNLVKLEARNMNLEGEGQVSIRDLIKAALRMRPNRIIVGEVRGEEAIDMLQAFNTGHDGSISSGHANSSMDMLHRLETMVLMGMDVPLGAIRRQIVSAVDIIIHLGRLRDKSRKVLEIVEVLDYKEGEMMCQNLYSFQEMGIQNGCIVGELRYENELVHRGKLLAAGYS